MLFKVKPDWLDKIQMKVAVISDLHLFRRDSHPKQAYHYLEKNRCSRLVINGDGIEGYNPALGAPSEWTLRFFDLVNQRRAVEGMKLITLRGNHDQYLGPVMGQSFDDIDFMDDMIVEGGGQKTLLTHGHVFDDPFRHENDMAIYQGANRISIAGVGPVQLYNYGVVIKNRITDRFNLAAHAPLPHQEQKIDLLREKECDALLCGHFHKPQNFKPLGESGMVYGNTGAFSGGLTTVMELAADDQWRLTDWRSDRKAYGFSLPRKRDENPYAAYREQTMHQMDFHRTLHSAWMAGALLDQFDRHAKNAKGIRANLEDHYGRTQEEAARLLRQLTPAQTNISLPEQSLAA